MSDAFVGLLLIIRKCMVQTAKKNLIGFTESEDIKLQLLVKMGKETSRKKKLS
jgi:hypothetical protein